MGIRQNKNKAVKQQNQIRDFLRLGFGALIDNDDITSRPMNNPGSDIILSPHVRQFFPFYIECKWYEDKGWKYSAKNIYLDVKKKAFDEGLHPMLVRKKNFTHNQFFCELDVILAIHSRILMEGKLVHYPTFNDVLVLSNPEQICISSTDNIIQFNEFQFFKIMSCLMKSFSL